MVEIKKLHRLPLLWMAALLVLGGCSQGNQYAPPPPAAVTVATPEVRDVQEFFRNVGQTRAVGVVELRARVNGYLDSIGFKDGDLVQEGAVLFTIDRAPYEAEMLSAEAALAKAKANLLLADQVLARTRPLVDRQALTQSELDQHVAEQAAAAADVQAATAALREAKLNLDYTEVRAPFTGRIGRHMVDKGNLVQSGQTLLATLESVDPIHAYFTVSESDLLRFLEMQRTGELNVVDHFPVDLSIGSDGDYAFHGHIDFLEFGVDPATGTTERRAVFANKDGALRPGLFVQIRVPVGPPVSRLLVPERALGLDQRGNYVLLVDREDKVEHRTVELGELVGDMRVVLEGLTPEDRVIVEGLQRATAGSKVAPEQAIAAASDGSAPDDEVTSTTGGPEKHQ